jgi:hypothetical protein
VDVDARMIAEWAPRLRQPDYYQGGLGAPERQVIVDLTTPTLTRYGY